MMNQVKANQPVDATVEGIRVPDGPDDVTRPDLSQLV